MSKYEEFLNRIMTLTEHDNWDYGSHQVIEDLLQEIAGAGLSVAQEKSLCMWIYQTARAAHKRKNGQRKLFLRINEIKLARGIAPQAEEKKVRGRPRKYGFYDLAVGGSSSEPVHKTQYVRNCVSQHAKTSGKQFTCEWGPDKRVFIVTRLI